MKEIPVNQTRLLQEAELELLEAGCVMCGEVDRVPVGALQPQPKIELLSCCRCGLVSASRIPSAETLAAYYSAYYHLPQYEVRDEKVAVQIPQALADHIRCRVEPLLQRNSLSILDFGAGDGSVARAIAVGWKKRVRITIQVIDYDPQSVASSPSENISIQKAAKLDDVPRRDFDLVVASAVLEHLAYPRETLEELLSRVAPGGVFYARTPYVVPFRRLLRRFGMTFDFTFPAHIHDMGSYFWEGILATLKLEKEYEIVISRPSLVETSFFKNPLVTLVAYAMKAPWWLLGNRWNLVGGWEIFIRRR